MQTETKRWFVISRWTLTDKLVRGLSYDSKKEAERWGRYNMLKYGDQKFEGVFYGSPSAFDKLC